MEDKEFLVTIYVPNSKKTTKQIAYIAKTEAQVVLRDNLKTKHLTRYHNAFSEIIFKEVNKLKDHKQGVAVFAKFYLDDEPSPENVIVTPLANRPKKSSYVGSIFDISQILLASEASSQTLVLNIHRKYSDIYILENDEFTPTASVENMFAVKKEPAEYKQQFNFTGGHELHHGTGTRTIENRNDQENLRFLNDMVTATESLSPLRRNSLKNILIFYTSQFDNHIDRFSDELRRQFNNITVKSISKSITTPGQLEKLAREEINKISNEHKDSMLQQAKERHSLYTEDWDSVEQASKESRIENLFIKVDNIVPKLVQRVIETGGKVILTSGFSKNIPPVAAQLRY